MATGSININSTCLINLGKSVKHYRKQKRMSQEKFARSIGLHRTYIGAIEQGRQNLTFRKVVLLADGLGVHLFELLGFMR
jgi:transcriptional regulator with XRE-family HTH domain